MDHEIASGKNPPGPRRGIFQAAPASSGRRKRITGSILSRDTLVR
jgi:hypothetical protein